jgi:hypothetical protein
MSKRYRKIKHLYAYITNEQLKAIFDLMSNGEISTEDELEEYLDDNHIGFVYSLSCVPRCL